MSKHQLLIEGTLPAKIVKSRKPRARRWTTDSLLDALQNCKYSDRLFLRRGRSLMGLLKISFDGEDIVIDGNAEARWLEPITIAEIRRRFTTRHWKGKSICCQLNGHVCNMLTLMIERHRAVLELRDYQVPMDKVG